eukprot:CAMPEP_0176443614 /NCGR_PEP_ID=MMETSP0127-20121128/22543_1 /TAXON_ID=938130 /ORGANISM="Platyophrya macrostoma, Strain WH" /LENGTH=228 /DNA_ID=CAMNT_0017828907 /DNA_START=92 /DNA_END=778 /DNA_ORIENTATION=-
MTKEEAEKLKTEKFDPDKCLELLTKLNENPEIDCEAFCLVLLEFVKIINEMSSALSIAFKDITSKVAILRNNYKVNPEWEGPLIPFIKKEMENKLDILNSENNKKHTKDPKYEKYESSARTVLRMLWFTEFLSIMLARLGTDPKKAASDAAKEAYEKALGPHHPFMLRQAAKVAMLAAPGRKTFNTKLFPTLREDEICIYLVSIEDQIEKFRKPMIKFFKENNLMDLP